MWRFAKLLAFLAVILSCEAIPRIYPGTPRAATDETKDQEPLPDSILPTKYTLDLVVTEENLKNANFSGEVTIAITLLEELTEIPIHAKEITVESIKVDGSEEVEKEIEEENDFIIISKKSKTDKTFTKKEHIINIKYSGKMSDTEMLGFYRSSYMAKDKKKYLATTQFETMGARRAFPCFDEPHKKAAFDITITYSDGYNALSNTELKGDVTEDKDAKTKTATFETTPPMSTYLVAFIVSDFECVDGQTTGKTKTPTTVCARPGLKTLDFALEIGPKALEAIAEYTTKLEYGVLGNNKLTQVAIPDFSAGAMENWGLITYREALLLVDDDETSDFERQRIVTIITHELSHQWFGDYVTLDSWADIFLNEGFATFFEYFAAANIKGIAEDWELDKQFIIRELQNALSADASENSKPLHFETNNPDTIQSRFDSISYSKGGSILRMVNNVLGEENFKKGLAEYLGKEQALSIATPAILWKSFSKYVPKDLPEDLPTLMDKWTNERGYPLLTVTLSKEKLTISQKPFSGKEKTKWYVPITYTSDVETEDTPDTKFWLTPDEDLTIEVKTLKNLTWIVLNNEQTGFYRVEYEPKLLESIKSVLENNITQIDEIKRSQLVDDQFNLAKSESHEKTFNEVLDFVSFLENDDSYYSWYSALNGFSYLLKNTVSDSVRKALTERILSLMETLLESVPIKKTQKNQIDSLKQTLAYTWACGLEQEECVEYAKTAFAALKDEKKPEPVNPNFRNFVYCTALKQSEDAKKDFEFLYDKYLETDLATHKVALLQTMGCVKDKEVKIEYLKKVLTDDIRVQDLVYPFQSVYSNGGVTEVIDFISENFPKLIPKYGSEAKVASLIQTVASYVTTDHQVTKLIDIASKAEENEAIKKAAVTSAKSADNNLEKMKKLDTDLKSYFKISTSSAPINGFNFTNFALILIAYCIFNYY